MTTDMTKSDLPKHLGWDGMAEELLARYPGVDHSKLLKKMVAHYFFEMSYGTKAGERAACDFLNEIQVKAHKLQHATAEPANVEVCESAGREKASAPGEAQCAPSDSQQQVVRGERQ